MRTVLRLRHDVVMIGRSTVTPLPINLSRGSCSRSRASDAMSDYLKASAEALRDWRRRAGIFAGADGTQRLCRGVAAMRQRRADARIAGRHDGAIFRAGIFAGADAAKFRGLRTIRSGNGPTDRKSQPRDAERSPGAWNVIGLRLDHDDFDEFDPKSSDCQRPGRAGCRERKSRAPTSHTSTLAL